MISCEDAPGTMACFDVTPVVIPVDGAARRMVLSCYELGWSGRYCCGLDDQATMETLLWRLELAFHKTGGVPDRIALRPIRPLAAHHSQQEDVWSLPFQRFCRHFAVEPVLVEKLRVDGLDDARSWLQSSSHPDLDACLHGLDILAGPADAERDNLKPLPPTPFISDKEAFRRVAADGFLLFAGDAYSVPHAYAGKTVWTRRLDRRLVIRSQDGKLLATHKVGPGTGQVFLEISHFEPSRRRAGKETYLLQKTFLQRFPDQVHFLSHLVTQRRQGASASIRHILELTSRYTGNQFQAAFETALQYNNLSHRFVHGLLEEGTHPPLQAPVLETAIQGTLF